MTRIVPMVMVAALLVLLRQVTLALEVALLRKILAVALLASPITTFPITSVPHARLDFTLVLEVMLRLVVSCL